MLVGVTGGIAAYKACTLVSRLAQGGASVFVAMTDAATRFVGALSFEALSGRAVLTSIGQTIDSHDAQHVALARRLDAAIVAPCSMDALARLAHGHAGDPVTLVLSAIDRTRTPVLLAPSMNAQMWLQASTQRNLRTLIDDGYHVVGPQEGWQACRTVGPGRMSEPEELVLALAQAMDRASGSR